MKRNIVLPKEANNNFKVFLYSASGLDKELIVELLVDNPRLTLKGDEFPSTLSFDLKIDNPSLNRIYLSSQLLIKFGDIKANKITEVKFFVTSINESFKNGKKTYHYEANSLEGMLHNIPVNNWPGAEVFEEFSVFPEKQFKTTNIEGTKIGTSFNFTPTKKHLSESFRLIKNTYLKFRDVLFHYTAPEQNESGVKYQEYAYTTFDKKNIQFYLSLVSKTSEFYSELNKNLTNLTLKDIDTVFEIKSFENITSEDKFYYTIDENTGIASVYCRLAENEFVDEYEDLFDRAFLFADYELEEPLSTPMFKVDKEFGFLGEGEYNLKIENETYKINTALNEYDYQMPFFIDPSRTMNDVQTVAPETIGAPTYEAQRVTYSSFVQLEQPENNYIEELPQDFQQGVIRHYIKDGLRIDSVINSLLRYSNLNGFNDIYNLGDTSATTDYKKGITWTALYDDILINENIFLSDINIQNQTLLQAIIDIANRYGAAIMFDTVKKNVYLFKRSGQFSKYLVNGVEQIVDDGIGTSFIMNEEKSEILATYRENKNLTLEEGKYIKSLEKQTGQENFVTVLDATGKDDINLLGLVPNNRGEIEDYSIFMNGAYLENPFNYLTGKDSELIMVGNPINLNPEFAKKLLLWNYVSKLAQREIDGAEYLGLKTYFNKIQDNFISRQELAIEASDKYVKSNSDFLSTLESSRGYNYTAPDSDFSFIHNLNMKEEFIDIPFLQKRIYSNANKDKNITEYNTISDTVTSNSFARVEPYVENGMFILPIYNDYKFYATINTKEVVGLKDIFINFTTTGIVDSNLSILGSKLKAKIKTYHNNRKLKEYDLNYNVSKQGFERNFTEQEVHYIDSFKLYIGFDKTALENTTGLFNDSSILNEIYFQVKEISYTGNRGHLGQLDFIRTVDYLKWQELLLEDGLENDSMFPIDKVWENADASILPTETRLQQRYANLFNSTKKDNYLEYFKQYVKNPDLVYREDILNKQFNSEDYSVLQNIRQKKSYINESISETETLMTEALIQFENANNPEITLNVDIVDILNIQRNNQNIEDVGNMVLHSLVRVFIKDIINTYAEIKQIEWEPHGRKLNLTISNIADFSYSKSKINSTRIKNLLSTGGGNVSISGVAISAISGSSTIPSGAVTVEKNIISYTDKNAQKHIAIDSNGVHANKLVGNIAIGSSTKIVDENESGAIELGILDSEENKFGLKVSGQNSTFEVNDKDGFSITNKNNEKVLAADVNGNLALKANLVATGGQFAGKVTAGEGAIILSDEGLEIKNTEKETVFKADKEGKISFKGDFENTTINSENETIITSIKKDNPFYVQKVKEDGNLEDIIKITDSGYIYMQGGVIKIQSGEDEGTNLVTGDGTLGMSVPTGFSNEDVLTVNAENGILQNYALSKEGSTEEDWDAYLSYLEVHDSPIGYTGTNPENGIIQTQLKGGLTIRHYSDNVDLLNPSSETFETDYSTLVANNKAKNILTIDPITGDLSTVGKIYATGGEFVNSIKVGTFNDNTTMTIGPSGDYLINSNNFKVGKDGKIIASNGEFSGKITATGGEFKDGIKIGTNAYIGPYSTGGKNYVLYSNPLKIDTNNNAEFTGKVTANSGVFNGTINATDGQFSGAISVGAVVDENSGAESTMTIGQLNKDGSTHAETDLIHSNNFRVNKNGSLIVNDITSDRYYIKTDSDPNTSPDWSLNKDVMVYEQKYGDKIRYELSPLVTTRRKYNGISSDGDWEWSSYDYTKFYRNSIEYATYETYTKVPDAGPFGGIAVGDIRQKILQPFKINEVVVGGSSSSRDIKKNIEYKNYDIELENLLSGFKTTSYEYIYGFFQNNKDVGFIMEDLEKINAPELLDAMLYDPEILYLNTETNTIIEKSKITPEMKIKELTKRDYDLDSFLNITFMAAQYNYRKNKRLEERIAILEDKLLGDNN